MIKRYTVAKNWGLALQFIYLFIMNVVDPTEAHNEIKQKEQAMKELKETQCQS